MKLAGILRITKSGSGPKVGRHICSLGTGYHVAIRANPTKTLGLRKSGCGHSKIRVSVVQTV